VHDPATRFSRKVILCRSLKICLVPSVLETHMMDALPWLTLRTIPGGKIVTFHEPVISPSNAISHDCRPSYITLVGKRSKTVLLNELLGETSSLSVHKDVYLRSSPKFRANHSSLVIIDSGVQGTRLPGFETLRAAGKEVSWTLPSRVKDFNAVLRAKVFSTFSGVICYFVNDLGGLTAIVNWLAEQVNAPALSDLPTLPRVLLVLETSSVTFDESVVAHKITRLLRDALKQSKQPHESLIAQRETERHFAGLEVIGLQSAQSNVAQARALKKRLLAMSTASMRERESTNTVFSLRHFLDLSKQVLSHICSDLEYPFHLARAARPRGFTTELFEHCLIDFLDQLPSQAWLWHFAAPIIASAMLLASYPPGAHGRSLHTRVELL
jgi:hypothetical protein